MKRKAYESPSLEVLNTKDALLTSGEFEDSDSLGWDTGACSGDVDYRRYNLD